MSLGRLLDWLRGLVTAIIDLIEGVFADDSCPIAWRPNALAPVFYAYRDYGSAACREDELGERP